MKIIALVGSPRKNRSNTGALVDLAVEGATEEGAESEVIFLPGDTVRPCRACDRCHIEGECGQKDEFIAIRDKVAAADGVIVATPNYIDHVSAQLKAFIDRCCGVVHTIGFRGKYGAAVVTSGGGPEEPVARYLYRYMIVTGITPVGSACATMGGTERTFDDAVKHQAHGLGKQLARACREKPTFSAVEQEMAAFRGRMQWLMNDRKDAWPYEYEYWKKHHGLE